MSLTRTQDAPPQESGITEQILGSRVYNPGSSLPVSEVPAGPESGILAPNPAGVILDATGQRASLCINLPTLLQRLTFNRYVGPASTGIGANFNLTYALADTVPLGKYWAIYKASAIILGGSGTSINRVGLYMVPPTQQLPAPNNAPYQRNPKFFQGDSVQNCNGAPIGNAIRVDEGDLGQVNNGLAIGAERPLIRSLVAFVPGGWTLIAYSGVDGSPQAGVLGEQLQLNLMYAEMQYSEDMSPQN